MTPALLIGCLWVIAAAITALLPMRWQYPPGLTLLILAPLVIFLIGREQGWIWAILATLGFVSMFRRPLIHLARRGWARLVHHEERS